jgi:hypothetical protein
VKRCSAWYGTALKAICSRAWPGRWGACCMYAACGVPVVDMLRACVLELTRAAKLALALQMCCLAHWSDCTPLILMQEMGDGSAACS